LGTEKGAEQKSECCNGKTHGAKINTDYELRIKGTSCAFVDSQLCLAHDFNRGKGMHDDG
jgi:hypothetical protein